MKKVKLTTNLRHDGENFSAGTELELEDDAAQALLEAGSAVIPGAEGADPAVANELAELRAELEDAEAAIESQKAMNAELGVQCEKLDAELAKAGAENRDLHAQIESQKKDIADLKKELAAAKKPAKDAPTE